MRNNKCEGCCAKISAYRSAFTLEVFGKMYCGTCAERIKEVIKEGKWKDINN